MTPSMKTVAFFAHDEKDAAIRRRVDALQNAGCRVTGFAMRRAERVDLGWNAVDLGRTYDADYGQRLGAIFRAARRAAVARKLLAEADVVYARNLDTALAALAAMRMTGVARPFIYECLDIHRLMHRKDLVGAAMRGLERRVLAASSLLVVSSPAFLRNYFDIHHPGRFAARLIENRIADTAALGERPSPPGRKTPPLRIGWFGVLRCERSLALMEALADRFGDKIEITMAGYPDLGLPHFHERVRRHLTMRYRGRYRSPEDLASLYGAVDVVWAGDFHDAGFNSQWLLPNRIYEGGYFATPAIAPAQTETGRWIEEHGGGFTVAEPLEAALPELIEGLLDAPDRIAAARGRLLSLPRATFVQPAEEMRDVVNATLANDTARRRSVEAAMTPLRSEG
jgi:succinoglycan biosynthesis protein ExoL